jgi:hypothetical protein
VTKVVNPEGCFWSQLGGKLSRKYLPDESNYRIRPKEISGKILLAETWKLGQATNSLSR